MRCGLGWWSLPTHQNCRSAGTFTAESGDTVSNYTHVTLEVEMGEEACDFESAESDPTLPECSLTVQLNAAALSDVVPATLAQSVATGATVAESAAPVWSQRLRVRLQPQGPAPTAWPEVSSSGTGSTSWTL